MNQASPIPANRIIQGECTEIVAQTSDLFLTFFVANFIGTGNHGHRRSDQSQPE